MMLTTAITTLIAAQSCLPVTHVINVINLNSSNYYFGNELRFCSVHDHTQLSVSLPISSSVNSNVDNWDITSSKAFVSPIITVNSDNFGFGFSSDRQSAAMSNDKFAVSIDRRTPSLAIEANNSDSTASILSFYAELEVAESISLNTAYSPVPGETMAIGFGEHSFNTIYNRTNWSIGFSGYWNSFNGDLATQQSVGVVDGYYEKSAYFITIDGDYNHATYRHSIIDIFSHSKMYLEEENARLLSDVQLSATLQELELSRSIKTRSFGFAAKYLNGDANASFRARSGLITQYASNIIGNDNGLGWIEVHFGRHFIWPLIQANFEVRQIMPIYTQGEFTITNMLGLPENTNSIGGNHYRFGDGLSFSLTFSIR